MTEFEVITVGTTKGPYKEEFPVGIFVRIAAREELENFHRVWRHHHPLEERQIAFAGKVAKVKEVSFYHGGDELYVLEDIPGIWHEHCLKAEKEIGDGVIKN